MTIDILLLSVPLMQIKQPSPAIYQLAGQLRSAGASCVAVDANILLYTRLTDRWDDIEQTLQWHAYSPSEELYNAVIREYTDIVEQEIKRHNPKSIGLSIFSTNSRRVGSDIVHHLHKHHPDIQLIIGGSGLGDSAGDTTYAYANDLLREGVIDYYITGEGEVAIVDLVCDKNILAPGINKPPVQLMDLGNLAFADYTDCNHQLYPFDKFDAGVPTYVITGSRGCVRRCDFCDVYRLWPKFKARTGVHIAEEMIHHYESRGVYTFYLSDSLINGSMKAFRDLYTTLIDYRTANGVQFEWGGQFICRTDRQMNLNDYTLARESGLTNVGIGLEHASEKIRDVMRKGFSNEALDDTIRNLSASGINTMLNFMVGHPLETVDDFEENIEFLKNYKWASDDYTIASLNLQHYIAFLPGTDYYDKRDEYVEMEVEDYWHSKHVAGLNFSEVHRRRKRLGEQCIHYGWNIFNEDINMAQMDAKLANYERLMAALGS